MSARLKAGAPKLAAIVTAVGLLSANEVVERRREKREKEPKVWLVSLGPEGAQMGAKRSTGPTLGQLASCVVNRTDHTLYFHTRSVTYDDDWVQAGLDPRETRWYVGPRVVSDPTVRSDSLLIHLDGSSQLPIDSTVHVVSQKLITIAPTDTARVSCEEAGGVALVEGQGGITIEAIGKR